MFGDIPVLFIMLYILCFSTQQLFFKIFNLNYMKSMASYFLFMSMVFVLMVVILLISAGELGQMEPLTIGAALVFGAIFITTVLCYMLACGKGPLSYTSLVYSCALLVPTVYGYVAWQEPISIWQIIGLSVMLFAFYLSASASGEPKLEDAGHEQTGRKRKINWVWLALAVGSMLTNGTLGSIQKFHQRTMRARGFENTQVQEFLIIAFALAAVLSFALFVYLRLVKKQPLFKFTKGLWATLAVTAGVSAGGNIVSMVLSGRVPAMIQFPVSSAFGVTIAAVYSCVIFKDRLTRRGVLGIVIGLLAIALIAMQMDGK